MNQNDQADGMQLQLGTAEHCLSFNYDADQVKTHIDHKNDDQPKRTVQVKPRS